MHMYPDVCLCVQMLPSHKDTSQLGVQLTPMASFKLNHPFLLNTVMFRGNSAHNRWESFIVQVAKLESLGISIREAYMLCS